MEEIDDDSVAKVAVDAISLLMPLMPDEEGEEKRGLLMTMLVGAIVVVALRFILCGGSERLVGGWVVLVGVVVYKEVCYYYGHLSVVASTASMISRQGQVSFSRFRNCMMQEHITKNVCSCFDFLQLLYLSTPFGL